MKLKSMSNVSKVAFALTAVALAALSGQAFAGADTTFAAVNTTITDWTTGSYGKMATLASLAVGLPVSFVTRSIMWLATTVGIAIAAYYGPGVVSGIVTATL